MNSCFVFHQGLQTPRDRRWTAFIVSECLEPLRNNQRIVSVNYLFGRPLIPYDFLKGIFTSNVRDMENLRPSVFGLIKMSFRVPKKWSAKIFGKELRPKVFGKWTKMP